MPSRNGTIPDNYHHASLTHLTDNFVKAQSCVVDLDPTLVCSEQEHYKLQAAFPTTRPDRSTSGRGSARNHTTPITTAITT